MCAHGVASFVWNILYRKDILFKPKIDPRSNYLLMTQAHLKPPEETEFLFFLSQTAPRFRAAGGQMMRIVHTITGSDIGTYMLRVTNPKMAAIEATYN
jgi:hypothetical protein